MSTPGYTAAMALRPAAARYSTRAPSSHSQGTVVPQMMEVITYVPPWAVVGGGGYTDPYGPSIGAPTLGGQLACIRDCALTASSCKRNCRNLPLGDREDCMDSCQAFEDGCMSRC